MREYHRYQLCLRHSNMVEEGINPENFAVFFLDLEGYIFLKIYG